ncbi:hypothetical protein GCM10010112_78310 [Actinoplanes lobatus]|uniref:Sugar lactone lactonase YvrE n=1 Tax=Actinoplanes lobatus TaxID=113568 RepID=A0A7W7HMY5_9ACTN|nr:SMP-30/gluconolactonase/LRE family protein [Actinoplanes lobatus]MBB4753501.1 sugar lactone lactonase YvrE [Actinoplanes lobatus]GGN91777.1 hypothetical protein GCM10010112_78310 [Actinoplanes lobatus]GIE38034.1 hypothetical protein Alo02nite_09320 [Actinoplanes lobatus]
MERLTGPSPLRGSNGIAFGPDGLLYVAEFLAGRIRTVDVHTGEVSVLVGADGPLQSPDDLAFDADGNLYVVDLAPGLVWRRTPAGDLSVVAEGIRNPNGICCLGNRLFVNEMAFAGRVLEIGAGEPAVLAEGLMLGNAMQAGPDGNLYFPHMFPGSVHRVGPDGGEPELFADELPQTVAVRFDRNGVLHVLLVDENGTVVRIDGDRRTTIATGVPGLDNAAFSGDNRMFVSSFATAGITEVLPDGTTREIVPHGFVGPYDVAVDDAGKVHTADHYRIDRALLPFAHGLAAAGDQLHFTSQYGQTGTYDRISGSLRMREVALNHPLGIAVRPDGAVVIAESGAGRVLAITVDDTVEVLAEGLGRPAGVAVDADGRCYVSDEENGTVLRFEDGKPVAVAEGLSAPQGLAIADGRPVVVESGRRRLLALGPDQRTLASDLPVVPPRDPQPALMVHDLPGVPRPFAGLATAPDGTLYLAGNADGSILRF